MSGCDGGSVYIDRKSRVIVDSRRFCESARPAVGEAYMPSQLRLSVCHTGGSVKSPVNVVSSNIRIMQIFAGVREIWGVKQESVVFFARYIFGIFIPKAEIIIF